MPKVLAYVHAYVGHGREAGAETTLANLLESLVAEGWEAEVILSDKSVPAYTHNNIPVGPDEKPGHLMRKAKEADVLISHLECSERTAIIGRDIRKPIIQLIHNTMWQTDGYLAVGCDLAVYNSEWVAEHHNTVEPSFSRLARRATEDRGQSISFRLPRQMTWPHVVVHPQVDPSLYQTDGPHDMITIVNLHENKGPEVFYELAKRFPDLNFLAVLGGYGVQLIEELPNVEFTENTKEIAEYVYSRTRILLMPSQYESFGRVAIEAAASGIPTIASPTEGLLEALGPEGIFCDPTDVDSWEMALTVLTENPHEMRAAQRVALDRSAHWDEQRAIETKDFVQVVTNLVR